MISGEWTLVVSCLFDAILLWVTARFMFLRMRRWRWLAAVACGQLPTLWVLLAGVNYAAQWHVLFIAWPLVMLLLAFGRMTRKEWRRALGIFYAVAMLAAGLVLGLSYGGLAPLGLDSQKWALWEAAGILIWLGWRAPGWWRRSGHDQARLSELQISFGEALASLHVLWDSGNLLRDPVLKRPVIIAELSALWHALPEEVLVWALAVLEGRLEPVPEGWGGRAGVVEFYSLGGQGQIPVIRPDWVRTWLGSGWTTLVPTMVGLVTRPVSENGRYQALASPDCQPDVDREGVIGA